MTSFRSYLGLYLLLLVVILLGFVVATQRGLDLAVWVLNYSAGKSVQVEQARGRLVGPIHVKNLTVVQEGMSVTVTDLGVTWRPISLLKGQFKLKRVSAEKIQVHLTSSTKKITGQADASSFSLMASLISRMSLKCDAAQVEQVDIFRSDSSQAIHLNQFKAQAYVGENVFAIKAALEAPRLLLHADLDVSGRLDNYHVLLGLKRQALQLNWQGDGDRQKIDLHTDFSHFVAGSGEASVGVRWVPQLSWTASIHGRNLQPVAISDLAVSKLAVDGQASGSTDRLQIDVKSFSGEINQKPVVANGQVSYQSNQWQGTGAVSYGRAKANFSAAFNSQWQGKWQLDVPSLTELSATAKGNVQASGQFGGTVSRPSVNFSLTGNGVSWGEQMSIGEVSVQGDYQPDINNALQGKLQVQGVKYGENKIPQLTVTVGGGLTQHRVNLQGVLNELPVQAKWQGGLHDGVWQGKLEDFKISALAEHWSLLQPSAWTLSQHHVSIASVCLHSPDVPGHICVGGSGGQNKPWELSLAAKSFHLGSVLQTGLGPGSRFRELNAQLDGRLTLHGQASHFEKIDGVMKVKAINGTLVDLFIWSGYPIDSEIHQGEITLSGHGDSVIIASHLQGQAGSLALSGELKLQPDLVVTLHITGQGYRVGTRPLLNAEISPQLDVVLGGGRITLNGQVTVEKATVEAVNYVSVVSLPDTVVFVDVPKKNKPIDVQISDHLDLKLMDGIKFGVSGLLGNISGQLRIVSDPASPDHLLATGTLSLKDGIYLMYGKPLNITSGKLIYSDRSLGDPEIDVRIMRTVDNFDSVSLLDQYTNKITVGAMISGDKHDIRFHLFSEPAKLSDLQILTILLTGNSNTMGGSGSEILGNLALSGYVGGGRISGVLGMVGQIQQGLLLDQLTISPPDNWDQSIVDQSGMTMVTLGKKLSKNIFLKYRFGLSSEVYRLSLDYRLGNYTSLRGYMEEGNRGMDVIYSR